MIDWTHVFNLAIPGISRDFERNNRKFSSLIFTRSVGDEVLAEAIIANSAQGSSTTIRFAKTYLIDKIPNKVINTLPYRDEMMAMRMAALRARKGAGSGEGEAE